MLRLAKKYLPHFKKEIIIGPVFKWIEALFELIVPLVMAKIIDVGIPSADKGYVVRMGLIIMGLGLVGLGCSFVCQYFASRASQGVGTMMRKDIYRHINTLTYSELDKIGTSSVVNIVTNDINQLQVATAMLIRLVIRAPFLIIGAIVMAILIDFKLALIIIIAASLIALVLYLIMSRSVPFYKSIQKKLDKIALITRENLTGVRVVRAFSKQDTEKKRFEDANDDLIRSTIRVNKLSALLSPAVSVILNFAIIAILYFGGGRVYEGALTQGQVIALINYINQIILAMIVVANLVVIFTKSAASASRVNAVFDMTPSMKEGEKEFSDPISGIELRSVSFAYSEKGEKVLDDVSFRVRAGQTIGIIGGTGAGKSTLAALIARFYDTTDGDILINGINIKEYSSKALRRAIGYVPQKATLFSGTLRQNLLMRSPSASDEELEVALETAQASDVARRLGGLDGYIEQGGKNLSGGQKQRLTIARALVGNPEILILDDSASALDFATDAALRKALSENTSEMTVFVISQRVSAVRNADFIVVLDNGRVMGIGSDEEMRKTCPTYVEICNSQEGAN